jgi:LysM repeat protein
MKPSSDPLIWSGEHSFDVVGTERYADSLRVKTPRKGGEELLRLVLPTLCITYADMKFANDIGGVQESYPASQAYGPRYFDPPVELIGEADIRKFTWIRGAHRVTIGPTETEIEWYAGKTLIIPRLRLDQKEPAQAKLVVKDAHIPVERPLVVTVLQYADGRHIGGIRFEKRHPLYEPPKEPQEYNLWVRVVDGETGEPMPEARLNFFRWDPGASTPSGTGGFVLVEHRYTNGDGVVQDAHRPSGEREAVVLDMPGWRAVARCFKPLGGQHVRLFMRAWRLRKAQMGYMWQKGDRLDRIALLTGHSEQEILDANRLTDPSDLKPGMRIRLPCYAATYRMESGDTYEWLARAFGYAHVKELARLNRVRDLAALGGKDIRLPGWYFFYARRDESLQVLDKRFGLERGSARTVGRVYHADPDLPYEGETIALPYEGETMALPGARGKELR